MLSLLSSWFPTDLPLQPIFALHFLEYPHFRYFSSIKLRMNKNRNWREAGDDLQVFEEAKPIVPIRNMRSKRKPSSHREIYLAVAEVYAGPGPVTSLTHSAQVSQTESWSSRSCNWEKSKCQFEREMLADYSRPRGMISRLIKKAKQCGNQLLNREGPAGKSVLENCPIRKKRPWKVGMPNLAGAMGLHRKSSMWSEMGKASVQSSSSPKWYLCSTVRGAWRCSYRWWKSWEAVPQQGLQSSISSARRTAAIANIPG